MKITFKLPAYVELDIQDGSDRQMVTEVYDRTIKALWEDFITKVKLTQAEQKILDKTLGHETKVRFLSKPSFVKTK